MLLEEIGASPHYLGDRIGFILQKIGVFPILHSHCQVCSSSCMVLLVAKYLAKGEDHSLPVCQTTNKRNI